MPDIVTSISIALGLAFSALLTLSAVRDTLKQRREQADAEERIDRITSLMRAMTNDRDSVIGAVHEDALRKLDERMGGGPDA